MQAVGDHQAAIEPKRRPIVPSTPQGKFYLRCRDNFHRMQEDDIQDHEREELRVPLKEWDRERFWMDQMLYLVGSRYAYCELDNYRIDCEAQQKVVDALRGYAADAEANIAAGRSVLLVGPRGCGKDHLLIGLAKAVFWECLKVTRWVNGVDLLQSFHRDSLNPEEDSQDFKDNSRADVLYVSDPLPPSGVLSEAKQLGLFKLIDERYRRMKPTWVSMNVVDATEADQRMGAQVVDRLRDNALVLSCAWESNRKAGSVVNAGK